MQKLPSETEIKGIEMLIPKILTITFNQDSSYFCVGTSRGFRIYNTDPLRIISLNEDNVESAQFSGGIGHIAVLYKTQIVALVGAPTNKICRNDTVVIYDLYQNKTCREQYFQSPILNLLLVKDRMIVVLSTEVYVIDLQKDKFIQNIKTIHNPRGVCAINSQHERGILATFSEEVGKVHIENYYLKHFRVIDAFGDGGIQALTLNPAGTKLGVINESGIFIKIYDTYTGESLHNFKRGLTNCIISHIEFDPTNAFIAIGNSKNTIHIYSLFDFPQISDTYGGAVINPGLFKKIPIIGETFLSDYLTKSGSKWQAHLAQHIEVKLTGDQATIKGPLFMFSPTEKNQLNVISLCGNIFKLSFNPKIQGECKILSKEAWIEITESKIKKIIPEMKEEFVVINKFNPFVNEASLQHQIRKYSQDSEEKKDPDEEDEWCLINQLEPTIFLKNLLPVRYG